MEQTSTIALTGDYLTSLAKCSYLGITAHYFDHKWGLKSYTLTIMKAEDRYFAIMGAEHFMHVGREWNIEDEVSTLTSDSARSMIPVIKEVQFEHMPCRAHLFQQSVTVSIQHSLFDNALAKCRKIVD